MRGAFSAAAVTLAVFAPVLRNGFVNWDDPMIFSGNPRPGDLGLASLRWMLGSFRRGDTYSPLCLLFHAVLYRLFGRWPVPYHAVSWLLHGAAAAAAYALFRGFSAGPGACLFATLIFSLHPLQVESVAAATSIPDLAACALTILSLLAYARGRKAASFAAACAAALWKWQGVCIPAFLLILDYFPLRRAPRWMEKVPFALVSLLVLFFYASSKARTAQYSQFAARPFEAAAGILFYAKKWLAPVGLLPVYYIERASSLNLAAALALTAAFGRWRPLGLSVWAFYLAAVAPTLLFSRAGPLYAHDRYAYLPCLAFAAPFSTLKAKRPMLLLAAVLGLLSILQMTHWRDSATLWRHALSVEPRSDLAHYRLGSALVDQGRYPEAFAVFQEELGLNRPAAAANLAHAHHNLGADLYARGRLKEAESELEEALRWDPSLTETRRSLELLRARRRN